MIPGARKNSIDMLEHHNILFPVFLLIFYMVNSPFYKTAPPQASLLPF